MEKPKIIKINEDKCNGCGLCVLACHEGVIKVIEGKAKVINESFCDGLGACIGDCPQGAITLEDRVEEKVKPPRDKSRGFPNNERGETSPKPDKPTSVRLASPFPPRHSRGDVWRRRVNRAGTDVTSKDACGCPGMKILDFGRDNTQEDDTRQQPSQLRQWPVQLHLLNPEAPYFKNADILIAADCLPFAYSSFHSKLLKGKILIIFCPKLDDSRDAYTEKLTAIFKNNRIKSITVARMEVPCCFGAVQLAQEAISASDKDIPFKEIVVSLKGDINQ